MKKVQGLSLVEVLISMAILGVVIVAVASSMATNLKVTSSSHEQNVALKYVDSALELYRIHWRSMSNYESTSNPNMEQINRMLGQGMTAVIEAPEGLDFDGNPTSAHNPPMRRITIMVLRGDKLLAKGSTVIGKPL